MRRILTALTLLLAAPAWAGSPSPYASMSDRPIRALSAEQQADLLAGRGMGLALAAELNGWPGPAHVLELADAIGLTSDQRSATETLMADMRAAASALGARLVAEEQALDSAFRDRSITPAEMEAVFEPFRRLEASRNHGTGGSGLGLTISPRAVEQHGGERRLKNRRGGGLVTMVRLPRSVM